MSAVTAALPRVRSWIVAPRLVLGGIVVAGTVLQGLLGRAVASPSVFPDEYLYSQLGRSLAHTGHFTIRGVNPHFLPVLEPILTAPVWLAHDVETSFRLLLLENAFLYSLAALPAYWIARRLGVGAGLALGIAALAISGPPAMFTGMVLSEPIAYPLLLTVVAATLATVERPTLRRQIVLLLSVGIAALDRLQLAVLPLCIAVSLLVLGACERRLRATLREQWLLVGTSVAALLGGVTVAVVHGFGYYKLRPHELPGLEAARLSGISLYVIAFAAGVAIVPSAVAGLVQAVHSPRMRAERAFGLLASTFLVLTIVQCVVWGAIHNVQERYLGYVLPLLGIAFGLRVSRSNRRRLPEFAVAAAFAAVAALVPLDGYAIDADRDVAPTLYAFSRLQHLLDPATAAGIFSIGGTLLVVLAVVDRRLALSASIAVSLLLMLGAASWSNQLTTKGREAYLPADKAWVDHAVRGDATMLVVGSAWRGQALATLFWNPRVSRVARMPHAVDLDLLNDPHVRVDATGTVHFAGRPLTGDVLVQPAPASAVVLRDADRVAGFREQALWRPRAAVRLSAVMNNRFPDGHVLRSGGIQVWAGTTQLRGWIEVRVAAPSTLDVGRVTFAGVRVSLPAGAARVVRVRACGRSPWSGGFAASPAQPTATGWESPILSVPRYVADPRACR